MKTANIIIAIILIIFGCYYAYLTTGLPDRNLPNTLGGSFMPWVLVTCFLGLSILMLLDTLIKGTAEKCDYRISKKEGLGVLFLAAIIIGYIKSLSLLGFLLATPIFLAVLMVLTGARGWKEVVLTSTLATFGIYLFFQKIFQIVLPAGELF